MSNFKCQSFQTNDQIKVSRMTSRSSFSSGSIHLKMFPDSVWTWAAHPFFELVFGLPLLLESPQTPSASRFPGQAVDPLTLPADDPAAALWATLAGLLRKSRREKAVGRESTGSQWKSRKETRKERKRSSNVVQQEDVLAEAGVQMNHNYFIRLDLQEQ